MADFDFNPLTGNLDLVGSGASYINGVVADPSALPTTVGNPALDSVYLCKAGSGVWLINRRPAGLYCRTANNGNAADWTYLGAFPEVNSSANWELYDGTDPTKELKFDLSNISTGTTRTLTVPNGNATIAAASVYRLQQFYSSQTFNVAEGLNVDLELQNSVPSCAVTLVLPRLNTDGARAGDQLLIRPTSVSSGSSYTLQRYVWTGSGYSGTTETITTLEVGQVYQLRLVSGVWTLLAASNLASPPAIGSTTRNTIAATTLNANNGTLTASSPVLDLSQTWNNAAVTFTGMRFNVTNTASAAASLIADFQTGGTSRASIRQDGRITCSQVFTSDSVISGLNVLAATSSFFTWSGADMLIARDAADVLAIRRSANPQTFRIYNTNDSSTAAGTNFERLFLRWNANVAQIGTEAGGTGSARNLELQTGGTTRLTVDNTGTVVLQSSGGLTFSGRTGIGSPSAGSIRLLGTDGSSFSFLYLGVQSASYPALKRSSTILQVRLGDDSAYTTIDANHRLQGAAPATSGATGTAGDIRYDADYIYVCTAASTWKRAAIATW